MTDLRKAAEMALDVLETTWENGSEGTLKQWEETIQALRQALAELEQEPVTLLPDGSAFGVMSFPLPDSHWLYAEREYRDGEHEPIELSKPILTHELRDVVVSAVRYAIRGATNCGKEMDFDPDALVKNAVYALCGPYTRHVDAVNMNQDRVDETAKGEHEFECPRCGHCCREWVGLTHEERDDIDQAYQSRMQALFAIEAKLKEKNT